MTFWKIILSYDGSGFHGWQVQPGRRTVQGTLSEALHRMTGERVLPQGSGRTDAGVHAMAQVASFALAAPIPAANLLRALNRAMPASIRVLVAEEVDTGFHARHSVVRKSYEYRVFERRQMFELEGTAERICPPFMAPYVWDCRWPLDLERMQEAAGMIAGTHDFTSFAAADPDLTTRAAAVAGSGVGTGPNPVKTIFESAMERTTEGLVYRVTGSGFLHHMVRNIMGTLVDVGRGALGPDQIRTILDARSRSAAGPTAPARGLFLMNVDYGERRLNAEESTSGSEEISE
jgi:tRNA pseudouridine38-40 synthase